VSARDNAQGVGDPLFNSAVAKAMAILESFGPQRRSLNLGEIARIAGMTKSSAQRGTRTLERLGYLAREPLRRGWVLTPRALRAGQAYLATHELLERITPLLADLSRSCRQLVSLWEAEGSEMVRVKSFSALPATAIQREINGRAPMCRSVVGRAHLLGLPHEEAQRVVCAQSAPAHIKADAVARLMGIVRTERTRGYAWSDRASASGGVVLAAPVVDAGRSVAVIEIAAFTARDEYPYSMLSPLLLDAARTASSSNRTRLRA
jgi:IclR family transcriptional regulator, pca regulon regulatory protein